jgi:adenosylcobinamide-phosphate synthase
MYPSYNLAIVVLALLIEAAFGYPPALHRLIAHPVVWIGALIGRLERRLNRTTMPEAERRLNGLKVMAAILAVAILPALALQLVLSALLPLPVAILVLAVLASGLLAQASLYSHVRIVAEALDWGELEAARQAVAKIVGRDTDALDEAAIARAAIESLAENFSDAVVAPAFWCALSGLPGIAGYKAANTADSMIGHLNPRYGAFGWAAARLDDVLNALPARASVLLIAGAAIFTRHADPRAAFAVASRYAHRHRSPNAGWPEGAFAGALGLSLAGPRAYGGKLTGDGVIGEGRRAATADDIYHALSLYCMACGLQIAVLAAIALFIWL